MSKLWRISPIGQLELRGWTHEDQSSEEEELATIRQYGQRKTAAVARAKAAARKAEEAAKAATADILMKEGTGSGVLDFEEEALGEQ